MRRAEPDLQRPRRGYVPKLDRDNQDWERRKAVQVTPRMYHNVGTLRWNGGGSFGIHLAPHETNLPRVR